MCSMRCAKRPRRSSHWKTRAPRPSPPACAWLQRRAPWPAAPRPPARHAAIDSNETITGDSVDTSIKHGLLTLIDRAARLTGQHTDGAWRGEGVDGRPLQLESLAGLACVGLPRRSAKSGVQQGALGLVRDALWLKKSVFVDAVLATTLVTMLTMATSLFSMQVYDRVIPNQNFNTLWVLVVGVALSIILEFILKQVRSRIVDHSCNEVDHDLSQWFFQRMLGIRMEARPASVGTLAAQVKGFEMVRGVLTSTSLFVLTDVPFALIFLAMITIIGGWLVVVPLIALPLALICGLMFQRAIQSHTR